MTYEAGETLPSWNRTTQTGDGGVTVEMKNLEGYQVPKRSSGVVTPPLTPQKQTLSDLTAQSFQLAA